jgi:hypothetical protein
MRNRLQQEIKNTIKVGQPKNKPKNEITKGQCFQRCGPFSSRHGCHKAGVTIEGDLKSVLSHNDPNTITWGEHGERETTNKHKNTITQIQKQQQ